MSKIKPSLPEFIFYVIIFVVGTLIYQSCTKNYYFEWPDRGHHHKHNAGMPLITSFSPLTGPKNTTVTIIGTGFDPSAANNTVTFNGVRATITSATATTLVVSVPKAAGDGKISVSIGGPAAVSAVDFKFQYTVSTLAGDTAKGFADGTGRAARFNTPYAVVIDANNNLLVTDFANDRVRKITPAGVVTSLFNVPNLQDPTGITVDPTGNIFVVDPNVPRILKITPAGIVSNFAGSAIGYTDGQGANAQFNYPFDVVADATGSIYVIDIFNQRLRKISPTGLVSTIAGNGTPGYVEGSALNAQFANPTGVAFDPAGNIYIADGLNYVIRKITPGGIVSTFAGNHIKGNADGPVANAQFGYASKIKFDPAGNMYITDAENNNIRKINPAGIVTTIAGSTQGFADGVGANAKFFAPHGLALGADGTIYVVDVANNCIRKLD